MQFYRSSLGVISGVCMFIAKPLMCFELFSLGHFLAGIVCAFRIVLVIYMAECSPDNLRGSLHLISLFIPILVVFLPALIIQRICMSTTKLSLHI